MDTALITFMIHTTPSTQSVHLIGSWDNFAKRYPMERDIRRSRGQWRGCYAFEDIICDGDGGSSPKRTGGLKMGSTYYYYYELDHGTEHYNTTIPFTTSCPYLPGQPVNLLYVPVEVQPLRFRSASMSSMANGDVKTMNPADKFMTPRQPPPTPTLPRLNTSPSPITVKRSARSLSPRSEKWSPRMFFGLRSPVASSSQENDKRGRSSSLGKASERDQSTSSPTVLTQQDDLRKMRSVPHSRDVSPQSFKRVHSREPSPLRQLLTQDAAPYHTTTIVIPDEIAEEAEDDENFASELNRTSMHEKGIVNQLSPPPSGLRSPALRMRAATDTSKPLPQLPEESHTPLIPAPLRIRPTVSAAELQPRSHFSTSTISTAMTSPTDSHFSFGETSISDLNDDEDLTADIGSGDEFMYSPILEQAVEGRFNGYSLPDGEYASEQTLRKESPMSPLTQTASRTTFGAATPFSPHGGNDVASMNALEQLLDEMGYLGDVIVGK